MKRPLMLAGFCPRLILRPVNSGSLAERWNGKSWAATRPPTGTYEQLWGMSCPAANTCFPVGGDNLGQGALVDKWNGKTWSRGYPVVASDGNYPILRSVSCSAASARPRSPPTSGCAPG